MNKYIIILILLFMTEIKEVLSQEIKSTAGENVKVDTELTYIKQLERYRRLRVYLPPDYEESDKKYPVLYMHDGQNLFDDYTSYSGEWKVDEILDSLYKTKNFSIIVVGIDNGEMLRINEYLPWDNKKYGKGEGQAYVDFIVQDLKPMIDKRYRTLSDRENTAIMGSSMGGLISHYAIFKYPEVFSKAGVFSPAYWITANNVFDFTKRSATTLGLRIFMLVGRKEGRTMVKDSKRMKRTIKAGRSTNVEFLLNIDEKGHHTESFWSRHFKSSIIYLFDIQ